MPIGSDLFCNYYYGLGSDDSGPQCLAGETGECKKTILPSFSIEFFRVPWYERFTLWRSTFDRLSVREDSGARLIREASGKEVVVAVDPTMALEVSCRDAFNRCDRMLSRPYLLRATEAPRLALIKRRQFCSELSISKAGDGVTWPSR